MFLVQVPATSANLGPGFDCMGLAVQLYNRFTVEESDQLSLILKGSYTDNIPADENNLLWQTMLKLWQLIDFRPQPVKITLESHVPPARGLGSSSTAVVGGLMIANTLAGSPFDKFALLKVATEIEGHPDNVTPALYGGITLTVMTEDSVIPRVLVKNPGFRAVVIIPDILVETEKARKILPVAVPRQDAVYNSSRVGLLVDAFIHEDYSLLGVATQDKLHQAQRASLIPGMTAALQSAGRAGAYGAALSGSGPTLIAFCPPGLEDRVASSMTDELAAKGLNTRAYFLDIDPEGAKVTVPSD
ncbi:homoserine kinase [Syntrophobotulus glycolicus DSM 8271]|uniref:Homoserine kinase n=1 Tax=Syntrophobotulus glycolicus (strain DSM 8271 / FlGlyR) TaxID=645991 RepID=F0T2Q2_SYNGF|nr:homoserine kinase [Syntrophobotulus glycolicus]ADY56451.1 homoserine kinase [Syntrophobotulus glycolicus DSM 8271]